MRELWPERDLRIRPQRTCNRELWGGILHRRYNLDVNRGIFAARAVIERSDRIAREAAERAAQKESERMKRELNAAEAAQLAWEAERRARQEEKNRIANAAWRAEEERRREAAAKLAAHQAEELRKEGLRQEELRKEKLRQDELRAAEFAQRAWEIREDELRAARHALRRSGESPDDELSRAVRHAQQEALRQKSLYDELARQNENRSAKLYSTSPEVQICNTCGSMHRRYQPHVWPDR